MTRRGMLALVLLLLVVGHAEDTWSQSSIYQRKIIASAAITGSPRLRDGSFTMTGEAAICGEIPKEASLTGEATFVIEVTQGGISGTMTSITFGSRELPGKTGASSFRLSVGVETARGGRPPQYVLNTDPARTGNMGTVTRTDAKGVTRLKIVGQNDMNERIELSVTCG
jgi:hypothetical protein